MTETDGELPLVRRTGKSDSAFRTISEVADELDVPQHVLRFWESKFPQVKPLKRGGGRRYYRPEDVALLRRIRDLLYAEGYTIKGVQKLLREGGGRERDPQADAEPAGDAESAPQADGPPAADGDAGEGGETDFDDETAVGSGGPLPPELRHELTAILEDLEQLRKLLLLRGV
ncbi:MAG: MerR family transcriptional regulator [Magnetospirillum sp.]|nr:MerR family transcriptional regulator [Magnetospirillum sp.]